MRSKLIVEMLRVAAKQESLEIAHNTRQGMQRKLALERGQPVGHYRIRIGWRSPRTGYRFGCSCGARWPSDPRQIITSVFDAIALWNDHLGLSG